MRFETPKVLLLAAGCGLLLVAAVPACQGPQVPNGAIQFYGNGRPPPKPGESISHTMMCTCTHCEPTDCCRELEQEQQDTEKCADGYDFSKCELAVNSCQSRCFQHRWRTRIETGCEKERPEECCHATSDF